MEGSHKENAGFFNKFPVLFGHQKVWGYKPLGGNSSQANHDFRSYYSGLLPEPVNANILLLGLWVSVLGRAAFYNVGYVDIFFPAEAGHIQKLVQKLACPAHKGLAGQVLLLTRAFAHKHNLGVGRSVTEDHIGPGFVKVTLLASQTPFF
jgi:hypothetical protein